MIIALKTIYVMSQKTFCDNFGKLIKVDHFTVITIIHLHKNSKYTLLSHLSHVIKVAGTSRYDAAVFSSFGCLTCALTQSI